MPKIEEQLDLFKKTAAEPSGPDSSQKEKPVGQEVVEEGPLKGGKKEMNFGSGRRDGLVRVVNTPYPNSCPKPRGERRRWPQDY